MKNCYCEMVSMQNFIIRSLNAQAHKIKQVLGIFPTPVYFIAVYTTKISDARFL